jgi:lactate racemase
MLYAQAMASGSTPLDRHIIQGTLQVGLYQRYAGAKVLVLIPDPTNGSAFALPLLFRLLVDVLQDAAQLDFMAVQGAQAALSDEALLQLVGIEEDEKQIEYQHVNLLSHTWQEPDDLIAIGNLSQAQIQQIAGEHWHESLGGDVPVRVNKCVQQYDEILILAPTAPHEILGFGGGAAYLVPGIAGPEMIDVTHWLSALVGTQDVIGVYDTPARQLIHAAADFIETPVTLISVVTEGANTLAVLIGDCIDAWKAAVNVSANRHIFWLPHAMQRVLCQAPPYYTDLWSAAKSVQRVEPAVADGGEIILYAPHLKHISSLYAEQIHDIGYHVRDYFIEQWENYEQVPLRVLAHSVMLRGAGSYEYGSEWSRIDVTLASQITKADCDALGLGYKSAVELDPAKWINRVDDGVLYVPHAGQTLYKVLGA